MYSMTFSYTPFRHCSVVPLPPNYYTAIKAPTHIKHRVAYEKRRGSSSSIIAKGGLKHLFDVGEKEGNEEGPIELPQDFNPLKFQRLLLCKQQQAVFLQVPLLFCFTGPLKEGLKELRRRDFARQELKM